MNLHTTGSDVLAIAILSASTAINGVKPCAIVQLQLWDVAW